jgi:hypothetical protein
MSKVKKHKILFNLQEQLNIVLFKKIKIKFKPLIYKDPCLHKSFMN